MIENDEIARLTDALEIMNQKYDAQIEQNERLAKHITQLQKSNVRNIGLIVEHDKRLWNLEKAERTKYQSRIDEMEIRITNLEAEQTKADSRIIYLEGCIATIAKRCTDTKSDNADTNQGPHTSVESLKNDNMHLRQNIRELNSWIGTLFSENRITDSKSRDEFAVIRRFYLTQHALENVPKVDIPCDIKQWVTDNAVHDSDAQVRCTDDDDYVSQR